MRNLRSLRSIRSLGRGGKPPAGLVTTGLVAYYDFIQGADPQILYDKSGNNNHFQRGSTSGADAGDFTWLTPSGATFDADDSAVGSGPASNGKDTFAFNVPVLPASGSHTIYSQLTQSTTVGYFYIYVTQFGLVFQYADGTAARSVSAIVAANDFVAITVDYAAKSVTITVNATSTSTAMQGTPVAPLADAGALYGRYRGGGNTLGPNATGRFFARYNRVLAANEVAAARAYFRSRGWCS